MPSGSELAQIERLFRSFKSNVLAVQHYHPQPYAGPVALFNASDRPAQADQTPDRGWSELLFLSHRTSYQLPGTHYSMLQPPQVDVLARQLAHNLEQALPTESGEPPSV